MHAAPAPCGVRSRADGKVVTRRVWMVLGGTLLAALPSGWSEFPGASQPTNPGSVAVTSQAVGVAVPGGVDRAGALNDVVPISFGPAVAKSERLRVKLKTAYLKAVDRLRADSDCRVLFVPLRADGVEMLARSVYARANAGMEASWCRHAVAGTSVGKKMVFLCRRFASLPVDEAATILIHEALHRAGMSESPLDRGCMTGDEISEMVRHACFLDEDVPAVMMASLEQSATGRPDPGDTAGTVSSEIRVARASSLAMPRTTSRVIDVTNMRSSAPY